MIENIIIGISLLILGWFLGIANIIIIEKLKRKSTKSDIINGIKTELNELQIHLASVSMMSVCIIDEFDKEYYKWVKPHYLKSFESAQSIIPQSVQGNMPELNELDDDTLFSHLKATLVKDPNENEPITFTYQNITIPFIDSKINEIFLLNLDSQKLLLILKRDINFLNNDINQIWFFNSKTYDNPSEKNLAKLIINIKNLYARIGRRAKIVVDNIDKILKTIK